MAWEASFGVYRLGPSTAVLQEQVVVTAGNVLLLASPLAVRLLMALAKDPSLNSVKSTLSQMVILAEIHDDLLNGLPVKQELIVHETYVSVSPVYAVSNVTQ